VRLLARAPAKVNLCLLLGGVRADGRHELVTVFESLSLCDELSLRGGAARDEVVCPGVDGPNLVSAALERLRSAGWDAPPVRIEVRKRIPVAAGMGGGSADAAAALRLASAVSPVSDETVGSVAAALGADVPSQLAPGVSIGSGAGELVEPVPALAPHAFVILPLPFGLSTADVYREADRLGLGRPGEELRSALQHLRGSVARGGGPLPADLVGVNDLGAAALSLCPEIGGALADARVAGADGAFVSGSGPTVAGRFDEPDGLERARAAAAQLVGRYPGACAAEPVDERFGQPSPG
jgi:4-diphosphocytidyl-2-C-methyl-D-erythritol kinase